MNLVDELIRRLAGVSMGDDPDTEAQQVQDEIMSVVEEGTAEGTVDEEQKKMIEGVISFRDLQVGQIMTPRTEIVAVDVAIFAAVEEVRDKDSAGWAFVACRCMRGTWITSSGCCMRRIC